MTEGFGTFGAEGRRVLLIKLADLFGVERCLDDHFGKAGALIEELERPYADLPRDGVVRDPRPMGACKRRNLTAPPTSKAK